MCQYLDVLGTRVGIFPLCVGTGLFFYVMLVLCTLKKSGADEQQENALLCPIPFALIFGVLTAYLSDVINHWDPEMFLKHPLSFGITYYGFLAGLIGFTFFYTKIRHLNTTYYLNVWLPPLSLAQAFGRIGCFFAGCCYGVPLKFSLWGAVYPEGSLPFQKYGPIPLFPVQLVEALYLLITFVLLFRIDISKRFPWYLILIGTGRFFTEFGRGDNRGWILGCKTFSPAQIISVIAIVSGIVFLYLHTKKEKCHDK